MLLWFESGFDVDVSKAGLMLVCCWYYCSNLYGCLMLMLNLLCVVGIIVRICMGV